MKVLEEKKSKQALVLVQKKHILMRYQSERDKSENVAKIGNLESDKKGMDIQDLLSFETCRSSVVMEEVSSESSKKMQDKEETLQEGKKRRGARRGNGDAGTRRTASL